MAAIVPQLDLIWLNEKIDAFLWKLLSDEAIPESELETIVAMITRHIMCLRTFDEACLKNTIYYFLMVKYNAYYHYDATSNFNTGHILITNHTESEGGDSGDHILCAADLVTNQWDYPGDVYAESCYRQRQRQLQVLKLQPKYAQKSADWHQQRSTCITATGVATALDADPYNTPISLLFDKCGYPKPFQGNIHTHHGNKYEPIANMFYAHRKNVRIGDYGLIKNPKVDYVGASPDGICEAENPTGLTKLVGRLLEIKCPSQRKIRTTGALDGDICPHHYYLQIQTQLYVTGMSECDFLQCEISEYDNWQQFAADSHPQNLFLSAATNLERGCLIQLLPISNFTAKPTIDHLLQAEYIYPESLYMTNDQWQKWIAEQVCEIADSDRGKDYAFHSVIYWRLNKVSCNLIEQDATFASDNLPTLHQFWTYVDFFRSNPREMKRIHNMVTADNSESKPEKTAEIFRRVHRAYLASNPKCKWSPLYQTANKWRQKITAKAKYFANRNVQHS